MCTRTLVFVLAISALWGQTTTAATSHAGAGIGSITGRVLYRGRVPPPLIIFEGGGKQQVLEVEPQRRGLRFAVVYLDARPEPASKDLPVVSVDQAGWMFRPPVVAVNESQSVRFTNSDGANHSVSSRDEMPANRMNEFVLGAPYVNRFVRKPDMGDPVVITCDIHAWMIAWVYVFDHRYHAVTDGDGRFAITSVPAGPQRLHVRHPGGGLERELDVQIVVGRPATVEVTFDSTELRLSGPAGGQGVGAAGAQSR